MLDTALDAAQVQTRIHRELGAAARLRLAFEMSALVRDCARAGIAVRHPEYTAAQVTQDLIRNFYGVAVNPA